MLKQSVKILQKLSKWRISWVNSPLRRGIIKYCGLKLLTMPGSSEYLLLTAMILVTTLQPRFRVESSCTRTLPVSDTQKKRASRYGLARHGQKQNFHRILCIDIIQTGVYLIYGKSFSAHSQVLDRSTSVTIRKYPIEPGPGWSVRGVFFWRYLLLRFLRSSIWTGITRW